MGELVAAVHRGDVENVRTLLAKCMTKEDVDDKEKDGCTALMIAVEKARLAEWYPQEQPKILRMIWNRYKDLNCDLHEVLLQEDDGGDNVFCWSLPS